MISVEEGSLDNQETLWFTDIVNEGIGSYIDSVIDEYNSITAEEVDRAVEHLAGRNVNVNEDSEGQITEYRGYGTDGLYRHSIDGKYTVTYITWQWHEGYYAISPVQWNQGDPYNYVINEYKDDGKKYLAGCGPVAVAQLMAYHRYPKICTLRNNFPGIGISCYGYTYNWANMTTSTSPGSIHSVGARDIAVLMFDIGYRRNIGESWSTAETGRSQSSVIFSLGKMGYTTPDNFSGYDFYAIRDSIRNQRPVISSGWSAPSIFNIPQGGGHYWLIDGVRSMVYYEWLRDPVTNQERFYCSPGSEAGHIPLYVNWVHCNLGWGGSGDAWYVSGIFDTRSGYQTHARSGKVDKYYQYKLEILPNVYAEE